MRFLVETDLGHDPDDLFAICHLIEAGHEIVGLGLVPGSPGQQRLACGLRKLLNLDYLVGVGKLQAKEECLGIHDRISDYYGFSRGSADGASDAIFRELFSNAPSIDVLVIGPAVGLSRSVDMAKGNLTMQGGFCPYSLYMPAVPDRKFTGQECFQTFNFNGCPQAVDAILAANLAKRRFCGKNVCHTVELDAKVNSLMPPPRGIAGEVYKMARELYLGKHSRKAMHDPTALVCHLHPEAGVWIRGRPVKRENGWTTVLDQGGDDILTDVDRDSLWYYICNRC